MSPRQVAFTRYGDKSRRYRRLMNQALSAAAVRTYAPLLELETQNFLRSMLDTPAHFSANVVRCVFALIAARPQAERCCYADMPAH